MSGQQGDQEDRTEAPTARRMQKARQEGQVPVSREDVLLASIGGIALSFLLLDGAIARSMVRSLSVLLTARSVEPFALAHEAGRAFLLAVAPFALPAALCATAATLAQTRFALRAKALHPDLGRLSPGKGLKRMFGSESLVETAKAGKEVNEFKTFLIFSSGSNLLIHKILLLKFCLYPNIHTCTYKPQR